MDYPQFTSVDELKKYLTTENLYGIDSEYSKQTLELISKFKAKGADLNRWWVMTPYYWECPACGRTKEQIVRLNKHGFLICHLHEHHDHMRDYVRQRFELLSIQQKDVIADEYSERFALKTAFALSAYDNTVICSDCNEVDKDAKKVVGTHKYFSYSPGEIKRFVTPENNTKHKFSIPIAKKIWLEGQQIFQSRLNLAETLASIAAENKNWYQRSKSSAKETERSANAWFKRYGIDKLSYIPEKLLYETQRFAGKQNSWRSKTHPFVNSPSQKEIEKLISVRGSFWGKFPDNWECSCCKRNKLECIQQSNKKVWSFRGVQKYLYDNLSDKKCSMIRVCNECSTTATLLATEALNIADIDIQTASHLIGLSELRSIIIARPNSKHNIDNEKADEVVNIMLMRLKNNDYAG